MRTYKPVREKVIVRVEKKEKISAGGIVMETSEREQDAREEGVIVAIGDRAFFDTDQIGEVLSVGDRVLFSRYAGKTCEFEPGTRVELRVMKDIDILCKIEEV